jgi:hypothetical protein
VKERAERIRPDTSHALAIMMVLRSGRRVDVGQALLDAPRSVRIEVRRSIGAADRAVVSERSLLGLNLVDCHRGARQRMPGPLPPECGGTPVATARSAFRARAWMYLMPALRAHRGHGGVMSTS